MAPILKRLAKIKCRAHLTMHHFSASEGRVSCASSKVKHENIKRQAIDLLRLINTKFASNANFRLNN
jgi:hypothetical protein